MVRDLSLLTYTVPPSDRLALARLPQDIQEEVLTMLLRMRRIAGAERGQIGQVIKRLARPGLSPVSLRRKWDDYRFGNDRYSAGDWRVFVNHAKVANLREGGAGLPEKFLEHWRDLQKENQRKSRPAWTKLRRQWRSGESIPGYGTWQEWFKRENPGSRLPPRCPEDLPPGWSYRNLMRPKYSASPLALAAARQGPSAVDAHRPLVYTTRVGLRVGQFYQFDDQEFDVKVNFPGQRRAMRPLGLDCLDVASACAVAFGFKPTLWDDLEQAKKKLREVDMFWLVVQVLTTVGYRDDEIGTTLCVECGTAAIREDFARRIFEATGGRVQVLRGEPSNGMRSPFHGLYEGASKGNFRFKAHIESLRNLLRNEMADTELLPGATGKDRAHCPEELHGCDKLNTRLLAAAQALSPERAALLQYPMVTWHEFVPITQDIYGQVNARGENDFNGHDLEGFEAAGYLAAEWRVGMEFPWLPWSKALEMAPEKRAAIEALIDADPRLWQTRKQSPREVFEARRGELTLLPGYMLPTLLGPEFGVMRSADAGRFAFEDQELAPTGTELRFTARCINPETGRETALPAGEYLTYCNPFSPDALHVCDAKGAYIGACPRETAPRRDDEEALKRAWGAARKAESELAKQHAPAGRAMWRETDRARANVAATGGAPATAAERQQVAKQRRIAVSPSDFAGADESSAPHRPGSTAETPAACNGEGFRPEPDHTQTHSPRLNPADF